MIQEEEEEEEMAMDYPMKERDFLGARFKALALEIHGCLPILYINEVTADETRTYYGDGDEDYAPDYSGEFVIDLAKFPDDDSMDADLSYVKNILDTAIRWPHSTVSASRKYSFGDSPEWWTPILVDDETNDHTRKCFRIDVDVCY